MVCFVLLFQGKWHEGKKTSLNSATPNDLPLLYIFLRLETTTTRHKGNVHEAGTFTGIIQQKTSHESEKMQENFAWCGSFFVDYHCGSIVDLQCCVNFCCRAKWFSCIHIYYTFFKVYMPRVPLGNPKSLLLVHEFAPVS